ncbi:MAG: hypothetical protein GY927_11870 [bacterium]|nr:hypothetical protein [bacterium]
MNVGCIASYRFGRSFTTILREKAKAFVEHAGHQILHRSFVRGHGEIRDAEDFQHRITLTVTVIPCSGGFVGHGDQQLAIIWMLTKLKNWFKNVVIIS